MPGVTRAVPIGAVETTSHAVVNILDVLMQRPDMLAKARAAALSDDPTAGDGFAWEGIRFKPAFPNYFRTAEQDVVPGRGEAYETKIPKGGTVLAMIHLAMFDPKALPHPDDFDPARGPGNQFHFGLGLLECPGRTAGGVMIPEIVRQALRLKGLTAGPVDRKGGPVPESWAWRWN